MATRPTEKVAAAEDPGGIAPLTTRRPWHAAVDLVQALVAAAGAARALEQWHGHDLLHGRVHPDAFVLDDAGQLSVVAPDALTPELAYLAPEQTGRLAHGTDERTDLYALGIVIYQLVTGRLPFDAADALEWAHCHLARQPTPPSQLVPGLPTPVGQIVLRLLAKSPGSRYQSAGGLAADLERCRDELTRTGRIEPFELGAHDVSQRLVLPGDLYGRAREMTALEQALDRACRGRHTELLCLSGVAGIGKSAVLGAIPRLVAMRGGRMAAGKFDQYDRHAKHATAGQLIGQLVMQQLAEPDDRLAEWRARLQAALGPNLGVLVDAVPALQLVVGDPAPPAAMPPLEARNRLLSAVHDFMGTVMAPGRPLVLVLDDLQWADVASVELVDYLLATPVDGGLLIVTAYRGDELREDHPAAALLVEPARRGARSTTLKVSPLQRGALTALLADTLRMRPTELLELATVVADKTGSNPLFVGEFLQRLRDDGLLTFEPDRPGWTWQLDGIRESPVTANMVELVADRIRLLDADCRRLLERAALLGDEFDVRTLSIVAGDPEAQVQGALRAALYDSLLIPVTNGITAPLSPGARVPTVVYRWSHDRVRQAAVSLVDAQSIPATRLGLGRSLLASWGAGERQQRIFELVGHLNAGRALIDDPGELRCLAELDLEAGRQALASGLTAAAREYLAGGLDALPADSWAADYELAFALHAEAAEAEHVAGHEPRAEQLLDAAGAAARDEVDELEVLRLRVVFLLDQLDLPRLLDPAGPGLQGLRLIGMDLPDPAGVAAAADAAVADVQDRLAGLSIDELFLSAPMTDPATVAAARFIAGMLPPATVQPDLLALITSKGVQLALDHGLTGASAYSFALHAVVLGTRLGDDEAARRCAHVAQRILRELPAPEYTAKTNSAVVLSLAFWCNQPGETLALLHKGFVAGMAQGDVQWATFNRMFYAAHLLTLGGSLDTVSAELAAGWQLLDRYSSINGNVYTRATDDLVCRLTGWPSAAPQSSPAETALNEMLMRGDIVAYSATHCLVERLIAAYLFGEYADALRLAEIEESISSGGRGSPIGSERLFYHALTLTALYRTVPEEQQHEWVATLDALQAALDSAQARAPELFVAKAALVSAERARVAGRAAEAAGRYDQAIGHALEHRLVHIEAIAAELAGRHAHDCGRVARAQSYLARAHDCYSTWGAAAKADELAGVAAATGAATPAPDRAAGGIAVLPQQLDLLAVVKASQAISGELDLDKLLATLLELLLQHAGAERGCLVVADGGELRLAAGAEVHGGGVILTGDRDGPLDERAPLALIRLVWRSRQLVVGGEEDLPPLTEDPYLDEHQPRSVLCAPLARRGETVAVIYLEHRTLAGAFTASHLSVIELLCAQAAISLENTALYGDLAAANQMLDAAFDQLPSGLLLLRPDLTVRRASARFESIVGVPVPPGTALRELFEQMAPTDLDGQPLVAFDAATSALQTGRVAHREVALPARGDRAELLLDTWAIPLFAETGEPVAIAVLISDITDLRHADAAREQLVDELLSTLQTLGAERQFHRSLLESLAEGIVACDEAGQITVSNRAMAELDLPAELALVTSADAVPSLRYRDGVTPLRPDDLPLGRALHGEHVAEVELVTESVHGTRRTVIVNGVPIEHEGRRLGAVVAIHDITDRRRVEDELRHRALHDGLTGLPNRALFIDRVELALARLTRTKRLAAVLFLDVDDFKLVNDTLGHSSGDLVLIELARRVTAAIRPQDTAARFGGDEFAVLCEDLGDEAEAIAVASRLRATISRPLTIEDVVRTTSISVGIAIARHGQQRAHDLIRDADTAMFQAKARGGGRHAVFDERLRHGLLRRLEIEPALQRAITEEQLVVHYQPKVSLSTGRVSGAEALVRWNRPGHDLVPPLEFITVAEHIGLIADIDLWVFAEASRLVAGWRAARLVEESFTLATNVSALSLNRDDLPDRLDDILRESGAQPSDLCIEITETALMADAPDTVRRVHALKELGVQLAIDDFGTGYSSLSYLRRFPIDVLKIDRSFVAGVADDAQDRAIARAVIALADSLELRSIAEGVETAEQLVALQALGCAEAQGFYFGPPAPADVVQSQLSQHWPPPTGDG